MKKLLILLILVFASVFGVSASADEIIGEAVATDIGCLIDSAPIKAYNIDGYMYVTAEELRSYGFNVAWDETALTLSITSNVGETAKTLLGIDDINRLKRNVRVGEHVYDVYNTDIRTYVADNIADAKSLNGLMLIKISDLSPYARVTFDEQKRLVTVSRYDENNEPYISQVRSLYPIYYYDWEGSEQPYRPNAISFSDTNGLYMDGWLDNAFIYGMYVNGFDYGSDKLQKTYTDVYCGERTEGIVFKTALEENAVLDENNNLYYWKQPDELVFGDYPWDVYTSISMYCCCPSLVRVNIKDYTDDYILAQDGIVYKAGHIDSRSTADHHIISYIYHDGSRDERVLKGVKQLGGKYCLFEDGRLCEIEDAVKNGENANVIARDVNFISASHIENSELMLITDSGILYRYNGKTLEEIDRAVKADTNGSDFVYLSDGCAYNSSREIIGEDCADVGMGGLFVCMLKNDGTLYVKGRYTDSGEFIDKPVLYGVTSFACGENGGTAICSDGSLWAFGDRASMPMTSADTPPETDDPVRLYGRIR